MTNKYLTSSQHPLIKKQDQAGAINPGNYKGMFYSKAPHEKYIDEVTGAHFNYSTLCSLLRKVQQDRLKFGIDKFVLQPFAYEDPSSHESNNGDSDSFQFDFVDEMPNEFDALKTSDKDKKVYSIGNNFTQEKLHNLPKDKIMSTMSKINKGSGEEFLSTKQNFQGLEATNTVDLRSYSKKKPEVYLITSQHIPNNKHIISQMLQQRDASPKPLKTLAAVGAKNKRIALGKLDGLNIKSL